MNVIILHYNIFICFKAHVDDSALLVSSTGITKIKLVVKHPLQSPITHYKHSSYGSINGKACLNGKSKPLPIKAPTYCVRNTFKWKFSLPIETKLCNFIISTEYWIQWENAVFAVFLLALTGSACNSSHTPNSCYWLHAVCIQMHKLTGR